MTINGVTVTAGIEQTKVAQGSVRAEKVDIIDNATRIPTAAALDQKNQQALSRQENTPKDPEISAEQIRVSVTTGQTNLRGNLSPNKAAEIYEQIAKFL